MHFFYNFNEDIPEQFHFSQTQEPPSECSVCGNEFGSQHFFIEKAFQKTHDKSGFELTFEYAICERCKKDMMQSISKESFQNIQKFVQELGEKPHLVNKDQVQFDLEYTLNHCMVTGELISELEEYHLVGIFRNGRLVQLPMLYGESFIYQYAEILSEETKDFFDDFFNHITILPPTFAKLLSDDQPKKRPVFI